MSREFCPKELPSCLEAFLRSCSVEQRAEIYLHFAEHGSKAALTLLEEIGDEP